MSKKLLAMAFAAFLLLGACSDDDDGDLATQATGGTTTQASDEPSTTDGTTATTTEATEPTEPSTDESLPGGLEPAEVEDEVEAAVSESLGGLTGGSGEVAIDDDQMGCMIEGVSDDSDLLAALLSSGSDPDYVPTGEQMVTLFGMMDECGLVPAMAEQFVTETPGVTQEQAECAMSGMINLPAATWDAILGGDPAAMDPAAMTQLFEVFTSCDINPATLS